MLRKCLQFLAAAVAILIGLFMVVLALHVAGIGGIFAFNSIKASRQAQATIPSLPPAPAEDRAKPDPSTPTVFARTYTVQKDDRLLTIARQFNVSSDELVAVNNIKDPDRLRIGQSLKIPMKKAN